MFRLLHAPALCSRTAAAYAVRCLGQTRGAHLREVYIISILIHL